MPDRKMSKKERLEEMTQYYQWNGFEKNSFGFVGVEDAEKLLDEIERLEEELEARDHFPER